MRKFSFRGAAAVVCDQSVWSLNWTQVQYICVRAEWKNQLTLCYNAVLIKGSSLQKCYGISAGNWLPIFWRHMLPSSNGAALCNIPKDLSLHQHCCQNLRPCIEVLLISKVLYLYLSTEASFPGWKFCGFLCHIRQLLGYCVRISHYHNILNFKIPENYSLGWYVTMLIDN